MLKETQTIQVFLDLQSYFVYSDSVDPSEFSFGIGETILERVP